MLLNYTDCEPVMCKMGRIVKKELVHDWQVLVDHRLEKTVVSIGHDWQGCVDHRLEKTVVLGL